MIPLVSIRPRPVNIFWLNDQDDMGNIHLARDYLSLFDGDESAALPRSGSVSPKLQQILRTGLEEPRPPSRPSSIREE